jgi:hypothetical protein
MKYKLALRESEEGFSVTVEDLLEGATIREIEVQA